MGIQETKDMLIAANEVAVVAIQQLKDGVGFDDFEAFYLKFTGDQAFKAKIQTAWDGRDKIVGELQDLSFFEMIDLAQTQISYVPKLIAAIRG